MTEVALGGRLHLAPIKRNPERILDIGTGTGLWAIDMGECGLLKRQGKMLTSARGQVPKHGGRGLKLTIRQVRQGIGLTLVIQILGNDLSAIQPQW